MMNFGSPPPNTGDEAWKYRLDRFARDYAKDLAALAWGFSLEWGKEGEMLGIDLKPTPHFVSYSRAAIEQLNRNTDGQLQEILGLIDSHRPEKEVLYIAIGDGQIKLIHFAPDPPPPACFEEVATHIADLIDELEGHLLGIGC
ncbi:MAG: hypothetical protein SVX43_10575 [Cyanobacteriota bacterium]|nr:hypothetical protein [Cyanobacteriota bacterium]